jgi:hypothetical protein
MPQGRVEKVDFTSGGAGNQWTTIDGVRYATWWGIKTKNWRTGDLVTFEVYSAPLWSGMTPIACAKNISKAESQNIIRAKLIEARALIADRSNWCMGMHASDRDGNAVYHNEPNAKCFCADGALGKVCGVEISPAGDWQNNPLYNSVRSVVWDAATREFGKSHVCVNDGEHLPDDFDDDSVVARSHRDILTVFDKAIEAIA